MNQSLEIVPYIGKNPVPWADLRIELPKEIHQAVDLLVKESRKITAINSEQDVNKVVEQQGLLVAAIKKITTAQKMATIPADSLKNTIVRECQSATGKLNTEKDRFGDLLSEYAELVKAQRAAESEVPLQEKNQAIEEAQRVLFDLEERLGKANRDKMFAEGLLESMVADKEINRLTAQVKNAKLDIAFAQSAEPDKPVFRGPLVPGGKTSDKISVEIEDIAAIIAHDPSLKYFREVVKFDVKTLAVVNKVKDQLDLKQTPSLPGIKITIRPRVDVKASVRIVTAV